MKGTHFEISFDNKKDFDRFVKNIGILSLISKLRPNSIYELAKLANMDVSNLPIAKEVAAPLKKRFSSTEL